MFQHDWIERSSKSSVLYYHSILSITIDLCYLWYWMCCNPNCLLCSCIIRVNVSLGTVCIWCDSSLLQDFLLGVKLSVIDICTAKLLCLHLPFIHLTQHKPSVVYCVVPRSTYHVTTMGTFFFFLNARQTTASSSKLSHQNTHTLTSLCKHTISI